MEASFGILIQISMEFILRRRIDNKSTLGKPPNMISIQEQRWTKPALSWEHGYVMAFT